MNILFRFAEWARVQLRKLLARWKVRSLYKNRNSSYRKYLDAQLRKTVTKINKKADFRYHLTIKALSFLDLTSGTVLCVGCRNAHELDAFANAGYPLVRGIDLVSVDPRIAVMNMERMSFPDNEFDILYSGDSLEHAYDINVAISEFCRVIKDGGAIAINMPCNMKEVNEIDRWDVGSADALVEMFRKQVSAVSVLWQDVKNGNISVVMKIQK